MVQQGRGAPQPGQAVELLGLAPAEHGVLQVLHLQQGLDGGPAVGLHRLVQQQEQHGHGVRWALAGEPGGHVPDQRGRPPVHREEVPLGHQGVDVDDPVLVDRGHDERAAVPEDLRPGRFPLPPEPCHLLGLQAEQVGERRFAGRAVLGQFHVHEQEAGRGETLACPRHRAAGQGALRHGHHRYDHRPPP